MAREFTRSRRVEEQIQRLLADVMRSQLRDPRVAGVVITEVRASRDLSVAWIHYSLLAADGRPTAESIGGSRSTCVVVPSAPSPQTFVRAESRYRL